MVSSFTPTFILVTNGIFVLQSTRVTLKSVVSPERGIEIALLLSSMTPSPGRIKNLLDLLIWNWTMSLPLNNSGKLLIEEVLGEFGPQLRKLK